MRRYLKKKNKNDQVTREKTTESEECRIERKTETREKEIEMLEDYFLHLPL
jgi:hypothetical protein